MEFYKLIGYQFDGMEKISREHLKIKIGTWFDGGFRKDDIEVENIGKMEVEIKTLKDGVEVKFQEIMTLKISHFDRIFHPGVYPAGDILSGMPHETKLISTTE